MQTSVRIHSLAFDRSAWGHSYQVRAELLLGTVQLRAPCDPEHAFHPSTAAPILTQGDPWETHFEASPGVRLALTLRICRDGETSPTHTIYYGWDVGHYFGRVLITERAFTVVITQELPRRVERDAVYVRRGGGAVTIASPQPRIYVEIDPCVPRPKRHPLPRRQARPAFVDLDITQVPEQPRVSPPTAVNPAVVPCLDTNESSPSDDFQRRWLAAFMIQYVAHTGSLARLVSQLEWSFEPLGGGAVEFPTTRSGLFTHAYGRAEGEGRIVVSRNGQMLSAVRVLVKRPATIPTRVVVRLPPASAATERAELSSAIEGLNQAIDEANLYLRQVAIALEPVSTITEREVSAADTVRVATASVPHAAGQDTRDGVLTLLVIHSFEVSAYAATIGIPPNHISNAERREESDHTVTCVASDVGSPSTSWLSPDGLPPDAERSEPTRMLFVQRGFGTAPAILVAARAGDELGITGLTLAHEVGHVLNLAHRAAPVERGHGFDVIVAESTHDRVEGVDHRNNLMCAGAGENGFDVAQAKVMWASPLLRHR